MEEIRQLERVIVAAGAMTIENVEDALVARLARRMLNIYGRIQDISPPRRHFVVCDNVRSFRLTVHGGSRGPKPNI